MNGALANRTLASRPFIWALLVASTYLVAYAVLTWPWVLDLWTSAPSGPDQGMFVWDFWWMRHSVEGLKWPFDTNYALAPEGGSLLFNGLQLPALLSVPLQWAVGTSLAYNLEVVVAVVLAGVAMYALARDFHLARWSAILAGLLFAGGPHLAFRYGIGHINLAHALWIPLVLLLIRRYFRQPSTRNACLCALALVGSLYTDFTIALFGIFLGGAYVLGFAVAHRTTFVEAMKWRFLLAPVGLAIVLLIPLSIAVTAAARDGSFAVGGLGGSPYYANDLLDLLLPNMRNEGPGYLGLAATILAVVAIVEDRFRSRIVLWLSLCVIAFVVLSLGPHLIIAGTPHVPFPIYLDDSGVPVSAVMPFTWIQAVFHDLRVPQRFLLVGSVPLALLAALGAETLARRWPRIAGPAVVLALGILFLEARIPPGPSVAAAMPSEYQVIASDPESSAVVVDVPLGMRTGFVEIGHQLGPPLIYATQHGHPVAVGFFGRLPEETLGTVAAIPLYRDILALQDGLGETTHPAVDPAEGRQSALMYHLKYVVIHPHTPGAAEVGAYLTAACFDRIEVGAVELFRLGSCPPE